jgi:hypothetical protein
LTPKIFSTAILISVLLARGVDDEGVLALIEQTVGLLGDHRGQQDVAGILVSGVITWSPPGHPQRCNVVVLAGLAAA